MTLVYGGEGDICAQPCSGGCEKSHSLLLFSNGDTPKDGKRQPDCAVVSLIYGNIVMSEVASESFLLLAI